MNSSVPNVFDFGDFRLDGARRTLTHRGIPISLNSKTFDLLRVLLENRGRVMSKDELLGEVWRDQFVEENNLTVQMSSLRKILGEARGESRYVATVPGRGYLFTADVELVSSELDQRKVSQALIKRAPSDDGDVLVGRERELDAIEEALADGGTRLVSLTGPGGTGKTRLAATIAQKLAGQFTDGVFFVELADVKDPDQMPVAVLEQIDIRGEVKQHTAKGLSDFLRDRESLLILDNFEQILPAAKTVSNVLKASRRLRILITSRTPLRLNVERELAIPPLAVPSDSETESAERFSSVELFVKRAKAARSSFVVTDENRHAINAICRRLDGLPLAIELAAARVKLLSADAILKRLDRSLDLLTGGSADTHSRQRTMRGAIEWSYELLDPEEKIVLHHLAAFAGGFTVELAERLCESTETTSTVLDIVTSLVENNLVAIRELTGEPRLRLLEVVREFVLEKVRSGNELEDLRAKHASMFLGIAEEAAVHLSSEASVIWLNMLQHEHDNFREALRWAIQNDPKTAARTASALRYFWSNRSHISEGLTWLNTILESWPEMPEPLRFKLQNGVGQFARYLGSYDLADRVYLDSLDAARKANDRNQIRIACHGLAAIATRLKKFGEARKYNEEELAIAREADDRSGIAIALAALADVDLARRDFVSAREMALESLQFSRELGDLNLECTNLVNLGLAEFALGDLESSAKSFGSALDIAGKLGHKPLASCAIDGLAALSCHSGNASVGAALAAAAEQFRHSAGYEIEPAEKRFREEYVSGLQKQLGAGAFESKYQQAFAISQSIADTPTAWELEYMKEMLSGEQVTDSEAVIEHRSISKITIEEDI